MKNKLVKRRTEHKYYARQFTCFWLLVTAGVAMLYKVFSVWYLQYLEIATVSGTVCMSLTWAYYAARENMVKRRSNITEQSRKA